METRSSGDSSLLSSPSPSGSVITSLLNRQSYMYNQQTFTQGTISKTQTGFVAGSSMCSFGTQTPECMPVLNTGQFTVSDIHKKQSKKKRKRDKKDPDKEATKRKFNPICLKNLKQYRDQTSTINNVNQIPDVPKKTSELPMKSKPKLTLNKTHQSSGKKKLLAGSSKSGVTLSLETSQSSGSKKTMPVEKKTPLETGKIASTIPKIEVGSKKIVTMPVVPSDGPVGQNELRSLSAAINESLGITTERGAKLKAQKRINQLNEKASE